jgi:hypothetical protein
MTGMHALWIPMLLSTVFIFVASTIIHMFSPWHKNDYPRIPREDEVRDALRPLAIPPGDYMVPRPMGMSEMKSPEFLAKMNDGPVFVVTVRPNGMGSMARPLILWLIYILVVSHFAAFVAGRALPLGAPADRIRLFTGVTSFLGYSAGLWQMSIWYHRSSLTSLKSTVDGVIYAAITAFTFAWLWPS